MKMSNIAQKQLSERQKTIIHLCFEEKKPDHEVSKILAYNSLESFLIF